MSSLSLRKWQHQALTTIKNKNSSLVVATPGAGKTTFAIVASMFFLDENANGKCFIVVPTKHLKTQWAESASKLGLRLLDSWVPPQSIPEGYHGICVTYAQLGKSWGAILKLVKKQESMIILDEIHHAGTDLTWGEGVTKAFTNAKKILSLSGTPYRSDKNMIPFIEYTKMFNYYESESDVSYTYRDALKDGVIRPVTFELFDGIVQGDTTKKISEMTKYDMPMLRAAFDPDGEWAQQILFKANQHLQKVRRKDKTAGGIVFCLDQETALKTQKVLTSISGKTPKIAISNNPDSSTIIKEFSESTEPWIVSVKMISEGVDIPRLKTGVYLTTTSTDLFFTQAVGRILRKTQTEIQEAKLFMPSFGPFISRVNTFQNTKNHIINSDNKETETFDELKEKEPEITVTENIQYITLFEEEPNILSVNSVTQPEEFIEIELPFEPLTYDIGQRSILIAQAKEYAKSIASKNNTTMGKILDEANKKTQIVNDKEASDEQLGKRLEILKEMLKGNQTNKINKKDIMAAYLKKTIS